MFPWCKFIKTNLFFWKSKKQVLFILRWRSSRSIGRRRQRQLPKAHREVVTSIYKQTKNRNETGSNLSLGTRLTVLSKRLGRKRCCDATPDRCLGGVPSHYLRIVNKCVVCFQKSRVLVGSQGLKRTKWKNEYAQRRRLRRKINSTSKSEVFPTWAPLPNPKEMKASLSKVQAFKFILQNAASKLRFSKLQSSNSIF